MRKAFPIFFKICADKQCVPLQNTACRIFAKEKYVFNIKEITQVQSKHQERQ